MRELPSVEASLAYVLSVRDRIFLFYGHVPRGQGAFGSETQRRPDFAPFAPLA